MTTHLVGFLLSLSVPLQDGTAPPTANEDVGRAALESSVAGQAWRARFSMRVTVDFGLDRGRGLEYQRSTALVRCAGEKLDITTDFTLLDGPAGKPKSSPSNTKFRYVSDGRWWTSRNLVTGVISTRSAEFRNSATRAIESHQYGFGLDGHFPGQARTTLVEALLDAKQRKVETRSVDGADCVVVSGSTAYGKAEVCLDPARDHVLVAARIEKFPESRFADATLATHRDSAGLESWSAELSDVTVARIGKWTVPIAGTIETDEVRRGRRDRFVARVTRSEIDVEPVFRGTDAFVIDARPGSSRSSSD